MKDKDPDGKTLWQNVLNLNTYLFYKSAILPLGIYPRNEFICLPKHM